VSERRPRRRDFDSTARYYTVVLGWLEYRYDDQVDRARKFHKITQKEDGMPVKRPEKTRVETREERLARADMEDMLDLAGVGPNALAAEQARIHKLVRQEVKGELTPKGHAELDRLVLTQTRRNLLSEKLAATVAARQAKHPEESKDQALLAVALRRAREHERRTARKERRKRKAERAARAEPTQRRLSALAEVQTTTLVVPPAPRPRRRPSKPRIQIVPINQ